MNIGLDFDDTFTADEILWRGFIAAATERGHVVYIVTCRANEPEHHCDVMGLAEGYVISPVNVSPRTGLKSWRHKFASGSPKRWYMEQHGIKIDVWIDDLPETILHGR